MKLTEYACVTTALAPLTILIVANAAAQTRSASGSDVEEVVVYGIRQSMESSIAQKRANTSQIDVDRRYAEGERISILGVDSRLISTTVDGHPIASGGTINIVTRKLSCRRRTFWTKSSSLTRRVRCRSAGTSMERACRWA